jgi:hypothetical protein
MMDNRGLHGRTVLLIKEHELCQESSRSLEATIWQSASVIGVGSIGSLALLATKRISPVLSTVIAAVAVTAVWTWWKVTKRWWSIQHAKYARMADIECELGVPFQQRYLDFLDDYCEHVAQEPLLDIAKRHGLSISSAEKLWNRRRDHQTKGIRETLPCLLHLITLAWVIYALLAWFPCLGGRR